MNDNNWFRELFIDEAKAAKEYYESLGGESINNQDKTITENGTYTADEGYTGLGSVTVSVARDDQTDIEEQFIAAIERNATAINIPDGCIKIGNYAFYGCSKATEITIPDTVTHLGYETFGGCTKITEVEIPTSVYEIENKVFNGCSGLGTVTFVGNEKPQKPLTGRANFQGSAFMGCTNLLTINVPWAEGEVANAPWGATNATINYNYTGG